MPENEKTAFRISVPARAVTSETAALAAGEGEAEPLENVADSASVSRDELDGDASQQASVADTAPKDEPLDRS